MVVCKCVKCGGTDENAVCENKLLEMQAGIYRQERLNLPIIVVALILCALGLSGGFWS